MRGRTPEKKTLRKSFYIVQNGGPAGSESAHRLKPCVHKRERSSPQSIRKHSENERHQPGQRNYDIALLQAYRFRFTDKYEREHSHYKCNRKGNGECGKCGIIPFGDRHYHRQKHEKCAHQKRITYVPADYFPVHFLISLILLRNCWFSPASSDIPSLSSTS